MDTPSIPNTHQRPWTILEGVDEAEVWVANTNLELNYFLEQDKNGAIPSGQGICFTLEQGGEIYLHTTSEGMIILDIAEEASWITPIVEACKGVQSGHGQIWVLPENSLIQLILGLNTLIAQSAIVFQHDFGFRF